MNHHYETMSEIEAVVQQFESCVTQPTAFNHHSHITVALWYLSKLTAQDAATRMRAGLLRFLDHYKLQGYNETMTLFWMRLVESHLARFETMNLTATIANEILTACADSKLVYDYYSRECISSETARNEWVEPDLKPIDF